jgi:hypothetical protein
MNPSSSIIKKSHSLICSKIKSSLDNLFKDRKFNIHEAKIVYTMKDSSYIYEDIDTSELFCEKDLNDDNEYIVYNIRLIINKLQFTELYYNLNIVLLIRDDNCIEFIYEPGVVYIENKDRLNNEIFQEYLETYNLFKNIRILNHNSCSSNYNQLSHRLSFSLNGHLYNRPDREYYIVMNNNYDFNIQVYKINHNKNRREKMLFGMWMNVSSCGKCVISDPFFI